MNIVEKENNEISENERKIMEDLRKKGGQTLKDYETFLSLIGKLNNKNNLISIGEEKESAPVDKISNEPPSINISSSDHIKTSKELKSLLKKQKEILHSISGVGMTYTYKTDLIKQLKAIPEPAQEKKLWIESMLRLINEQEKNPPKNYGCLIAIFVFLGLPLILFISSKMGMSDLFERTFNPQKYWRMQVATLEEDIHKTQLFIKDWENYRSDKDKIKIDYDSLVRRLIIEGKDPAEAKKIAADDIREIDKAEKEADAKMIKVREQMLETSYKSLDEYKIQLERAKKELTKHL